MNKKSIKDFIQKNGNALAIPLVMIVLGLFFIFFPGSAIDITVKVVGIMFVIVGAVMACSLLAAYSPFTLAISIILIIFGILCIASPGFIASFVIKAIGVMILLNELVRIYEAYKIKGKSDKFIQYIIVDVVTLILGIVLIAMPMNIAGAIVIVMGVVLLILGVTNIITAIKVYKDGRYVEDGTDVVWEE
ncbi:MAG: DUF308 domain-containing protein [Eubacterium sp.]|nr:DUF308 domain-containing protein [Eubacterium sp.]